MNRDVYFSRSRSKPSMLLFESCTISTYSESLVYTVAPNLLKVHVSRFATEKVKNLIHYDRDASMFQGSFSGEI